MYFRVLLWYLAAAFFVTLPFASARAGTIEITTDTVIDAGNSFADDRVIVREGDDGPTTLTIVDGGLLGGGVTLLEGSHLEMTGGTIMTTPRVSGFAILDNSTVSISGGLVTGNTMLVEFASATITGGAVIESSLLVGIDGRVSISGGQMSPIGVSGNGRVSIISGKFSVGLSADDTARIEIFGGDFLPSELDPIDFIIGDTMNDNVALDVHGFNLATTDGRLTGTLADGSPLNNPISISENSNVFLWNVPEPSSIAMAILVAAFYCLRSTRVRIGGHPHKRHWTIH